MPTRREHVAVLGHRKIGLIARPLRLRSAGGAEVAFAAWFAQDWVGGQSRLALVEGDYILKGGRDAVRKVIALLHRTTVVLGDHRNAR